MERITTQLKTHLITAAGRRPTQYLASKSKIATFFPNIFMKSRIRECLSASGGSLIFVSGNGRIRFLCGSRPTHSFSSPPFLAAGGQVVSL